MKFLTRYQMKEDHEKDMQTAKARINELNEEHFQERERFIAQLHKVCPYNSTNQEY